MFAIGYNVLTIMTFDKIISSFTTHGKNRVSMANTAQAKKRARQAEDSRIRNASQRSNLRTFIKKVVAAVNSGDREKALAAYKIAVPVIDSAVTKGLIHKNNAARNKSRLNNKIRMMA
jgi:small subunit ribosomal protein S20